MPRSTNSLDDTLLLLTQALALALALVAATGGKVVGGKHAGSRQKG